MQNARPKEAADGSQRAPPAHLRSITIETISARNHSRCRDESGLRESVLADLCDKWWWPLLSERWQQQVPPASSNRNLSVKNTTSMQRERTCKRVGVRAAVRTRSQSDQSEIWRFGNQTAEPLVRLARVVAKHHLHVNYINSVAV